MGKQSGGIMPWDSLVNFTSNMIDLGVNTAQQNKWNKQQQKNWEQQFQYQKELNNLMMQREDTAVQRKARDLQAAGFNKLLAATGEAAPVSGMTTFGGNAGGEANKISIGKIAPIAEIMQVRQMRENIQLTKAETQKKNMETLTEIQKENLTRVEALYKEWLTATEKARKRQIEAEAANIAADTANKARELEISNWSGLPPGTDPRVNNWFQSASGAAIAAESSGNNIFKGLGTKEEQERFKDMQNNTFGWRFGLGSIYKAKDGKVYFKNRMSKDEWNKLLKQNGR